ncbi:MAG: hypothetical protein NTY93_00465 [Candidatus Kaiserbacteria bacterium]|nr:hypothetical protein [Candidatus Kaiserbacteria bacterium]
MWENLSENDMEKYLRRWIQETTKDESELSLKKHIVKHAKEINQKDPTEWLASMKNLVEAYEEKTKAIPSVVLRVQKLANKYKKNKRRYTPPPKI